VIDARDVPTDAEARAIRPRAEDPTRLENGNFHPRYAEWLISRTWEESRPLLTFLMNHSDPVTGADGYFDRAGVKRAIGATGRDYWKPGGPIPSKAKIPLLANLLGVDAAEVAAVVLAEKKARQDYDTLVSRCRWLPYKLLTYEQMAAGVPCPACGRPWKGTAEPDAEASFRRDHAECRTGCHAVGDGPTHCMRCCGFPSPSPETLERVNAILASARDRGSQEAESRTSMTRAERRERRIEKLEAELAKLRALQADDEGDR
jgi:hypothetical protein